MTSSITVRDVPDEVRDELAARAAMSGQSLQEYLLSWLMELARRHDSETTAARIRARKPATKSTLPTNRILADLNEDRR